MVIPGHTEKSIIFENPPVLKNFKILDNEEMRAPREQEDLTEWIR